MKGHRFNAEETLATGIKDSLGKKDKVKYSGYQAVPSNCSYLRQAPQPLQINTLGLCHHRVFRHLLRVLFYHHPRIVVFEYLGDLIEGFWICSNILRKEKNKKNETVQ